MSDQKLTPERLRKIRHLLDMPLEYFADLGPARGFAALGEAGGELLVALDAERAAHRETRAEVRKAENYAGDCLAQAVLAVEERDEALTEVERLKRALAKAKRWPVP